MGALIVLTRLFVHHFRASAGLAARVGRKEQIKRWERLGLLSNFLVPQTKVLLGLAVTQKKIYIYINKKTAVSLKGLQRVPGAASGAFQICISFFLESPFWPHGSFATGCGDLQSYSASVLLTLTTVLGSACRGNQALFTSY